MCHFTHQTLRHVSHPGTPIETHTGGECSTHQTVERVAKLASAHRQAVTLPKPHTPRSKYSRSSRIAVQLHDDLIHGRIETVVTTLTLQAVAVAEV